MAEGTKFCPQCGHSLAAQAPAKVSNAESTVELVRDFATGATREIKDTGRAALRSELGKKMAAGAAIGAVAAAVIPFIGWGVGAVAGAGLVAYRRLLK